MLLSFCRNHVSKSFRNLKASFYVADRHNLAPGRMAKVVLLYVILNSKFCEHGINHERLSIDDAMCPYYERHESKQFIYGKPIRFGYKSWCMVSATGMPYFVSIYEGADKSGQTHKEGLGSRVVKMAADICQDPKNHHLFFDNFFTLYQLVKDLKEGGILRNWYSAW